jgi:DNA-binding protein HU-beta
MKRSKPTLIERLLMSNKNDLINAVAEQTGLTKADSGRAIDAVFDAITATLKSGDDVRLVGFGTFLVTKRAASEGRNPRTGAKIKIAASTQPKFRAGKGLKDAVN